MQFNIQFLWQLFSEFAKLSISLKLDTWLQNFLIDYAMYKGKLDEALTFLNQLHEPSLELSKNLKYANIMYLKKSFVVCEHASFSSLK